MSDAHQRLSAEAEQRVYTKALVANAGFVLLCVAVGGLSADLLQIWALEVLELTPRQLGIAFGLMALSIPFQLRAIQWVNNVGQRRAMSLGYSGIALGLVALLCVGLLDQSGSRTASAGLFYVAVLWIEICISCSWGNAWLSWVGAFTTPASRPNFIRRMRLSTQSVYTVGLLAFSLLIRNEPRPWHFYLLYGCLLGYVLVAIVLYSRLPDTRSTEDEPTGLGQGLHDRRLRRALLFVLIQSLVAVPLVATWLLLREYPAFLITVGSALQSIVSIATLLLLRPALSEWPPARTVRVFGVALAICLLLYLTLPTYNGAPDGAWYLSLLVASSLASAGFMVGWFALMYDLIPDEASVVGFALSDLITSSAGQVYALAAGAGLSAVAGATLLGTSGLESFKILFVVAAAASTVLAFLATKASEQQAEGQIADIEG